MNVRIHTSDSQGNLTGKVVDIAYPLVGMKLACSQEFYPDSYLRVEFFDADDQLTFTCDGSVAWCMRKDSGEASDIPLYHVGLSINEPEEEI